MSLIDEKVLHVIRQSTRTISLVAIAADIGCAPITVRRSVKRLQASGRLKVEAPEGRVFRFIIVDEEP